MHTYFIFLVSDSDWVIGLVPSVEGFSRIYVP